MQREPGNTEPPGHYIVAVSNQQNGYPPPRGSNKTVPIVFSVVVVLVVLGAGIFVVSRFAGASEYTAGTPTSPSPSQPTDDAPSETPTTGGNPSSQPTGLPGVLPIFIVDAAVRQQIVAFTATNAGHADNGPSTLRDGKAGNYRLSCHGVSGATVGKGGKSASSYSTSVNIYGPSAY